jgi:hypothetical protein
METVFTYDIDDKTKQMMTTFDNIPSFDFSKLLDIPTVELEVYRTVAYDQYREYKKLYDKKELDHVGFKNNLQHNLSIYIYWRDIFDQINIELTQRLLKILTP